MDPYPDLLSNQDEGDTKVILHANKILEDDPNAMVTIQSPSGDRYCSIGDKPLVCVRKTCCIG